MTLRADDAGVWEQRIDHGSLVRPTARPDGTYFAEGYPVREGVLEYRRADGTVRREFVPASTLAASAHGLARLPVTLEHPVENGQVVPVTPDNYAAHVVGDTDGDVVVEEGGFVRVQFALRRRDSLEAIRGGTRELSALYNANMDWTPGEHPVYGRYDGTQTSRDYNSIALTRRGRAGREARLRADGAELVETIERPTPATNRIPTAAPPHHEVPAMKPHWLPLLLAAGITLRADATDETAAEALRAHLDRQAEKQRADSATHTTALAAATARADAAEARVKALEAAEATRADAADRLALEPVATALGVDPKTCADTKALRRAVAAKKLGSDLRADATDAYVDALVDLARADHGKERHRADPAGVQAGAAAWRPGQAARADAADPGQRPTRRPTANEQHAKRVAEARKAQGLG